MQAMGEKGTDESCPFDFNFDAASFKVGDTVSYRVVGFDGFPFAGTLLEVHDDHVLINAEDGSPPMRGTRESRPVVEASEVR